MDVCQSLQSGYHLCYYRALARWPCLNKKDKLLFDSMNMLNGILDHFEEHSLMTIDRKSREFIREHCDKIRDELISETTKHSEVFAETIGIGRHWPDDSEGG